MPATPLTSGQAPSTTRSWRRARHARLALRSGRQTASAGRHPADRDGHQRGAVLDLLGELRAALGLALLFISHDLGVVAAIADRVIVLRDRTIQEAGAARDVLNRPRTAYAQRLAASAPRLADRSD